MGSAKKLPDSFVQYDGFGQNQWKKAVLLLAVLSILVVIPWYILFNWLAGVLRADFVGALSLRPTFKLVSIAMMLIIFLISVAVHELIHILFLWPGSDERPQIVFGWAGVHIDINGLYLPRNRFLVANLAPFCLLTLAGLLVLFIASETLIKAVIFGLTVNAAGSTPDLVSSVFISLFPASSLITTRGTLYIEKRYLTPQKNEEELEWKLQPFLEKFTAKF